MLEARGVEPPGVREMVEDFEDQARLNSPVCQNVGHISLSFSPEDAPKLTDERMTQIAREYMQKMGITDTQYLFGAAPRPAPSPLPSGLQSRR